MPGVMNGSPRFAERVGGMTASEVRALFAVASRPEVISLAGGMPFVQGLPGDEVLRVVSEVVSDRAAVALQYGAGSGQVGLKDRLVEVMAREGASAEPDGVLITAGAQQALT
jgi:2-aminoadipate transaminase